MNHALSIGMPVYELRLRSAVRVSEPVAALNHDETLELFAHWRERARQEESLRTGRA